MRVSDIADLVPCKDGIESVEEAREGDLSLAFLRFVGVAFESVDFSGLTLSDVAFVDCSFGQASMTEASCRGVRFHRCDCSNLSFSGSLFRDCEFVGTKCMGAGFSDCRFDRVSFCSSNFRFADFGFARFARCVFSSSDFTESFLTDCKFGKEIRLDRSRFDSCDFSRTSLKGLDLSACEIESIHVSAAAAELKGAVVDRFQAAELARLLGIVIKA
jgi:uncharacterized protein YjbI with pentapeptide repeats